ncbi:MAG: hypothetical protein GYB31_20960 [Bacteroidetes bacterium]|nr:hypothetical protein [Bacteroidota bacterium]
MLLSIAVLPAEGCSLQPQTQPANGRSLDLTAGELDPADSGVPPLAG